MLDGLRIMSKNLFGRLILASFAAVIVIGFGLWGIRDMFSNFRGNELATVGATDIGLQQFQNAYQTELQRLQRQAQRPISGEEARKFGLDRQVLAELITSAALDQDAKNLGLGLPDSELARQIQSEKIFAGPNGAFDAETMRRILRDNGYTEESYVREQRAVALRKQIAQAVTGDLAAPQALFSAVNQFANQTRKADYALLPAPDLSAAPTPTDAAVQAFYDMRKASFRAPEYRNVTLLVVTPESLAKSLTIDDALAEKVYNETKERFSTPEKRQLIQLTFADAAKAAEASAQLKAGKSFEQIAADKSLGGVRADLGLTTRDAIFDAEVAAAAFAPSAPGVTAPVAGKFGVVLVDVVTIAPGAQKSFAEVKDQIKAELALSQAKTALQTTHDKIEDLRTSGKTLSEAAKAAGLAPTLLATDATGAQKGVAGQPGPANPALAAAPELTKAIFASDVGVDNDAVTLKNGGYGWFEISAIDPAHQLALDELRPQVIAALQQSDAQNALAARANALAKRLDAGENFKTLAAAENLTLKSSAALKRAAGQALPDVAIQQVFGTPQGGAGVALGPNGARVLFQVTEVVTPPLDLKDPTLKGLTPQLEASLADDMFSEYVSGLESTLGVRINQAALRAIGGQGQE